MLICILVLCFGRAWWAGRGRGWGQGKLHPFCGKMRSPLVCTLRRRRRKWTSAKCLSISQSAFAFSAWFGFSMPCTCGPAWLNVWPRCTLRHESSMTTAPAQRFPQRGSGDPTGLRSTLGWKPEVLNPSLQVTPHYYYFYYYYFYYFYLLEQFLSRQWYPRRAYTVNQDASIRSIKG